MNPISSIYDNERLKNIVINMFPEHEVMFMYYCGSIAYNTVSSNSDIDITVVLHGFKGLIHTSIEGIDIFGYGYHDFLKRQEMDADIPLYNRLHADDIINAREHTIFINPLFTSEFEALVDTEFSSHLDKFLDTFIEYYDQIINKDNMLVKRAYHILRIRAILDNYIRSGKYTLTLSEDWIKRINELKTNWDKTSDTSYLVTLKQYLQEIKDIRNGVFQNE
jgi:predicted nucleotidyltransferase